MAFSKAEVMHWEQADFVRSLDGVIAQSIKLQGSLKLKLQHTGPIPAHPQEIGQ
ncbi:hypothetical protein X734_07965 [Mesorhizobium sp. L2C084A000]|nr:hypothetical protein X734_07965 [Mesorhizobium sp. L2C084A000]